LVLDIANEAGDYKIYGKKGGKWQDYCYYKQQTKNIKQKQKNPYTTKNKKKKLGHTGEERKIGAQKVNIQREKGEMELSMKKRVLLSINQGWEIRWGIIGEGKATVGKLSRGESARGTMI